MDAEGTTEPHADEQIAALEARAEKLRTILQSGSAKRPLIVEFSGSPKAGKTRCISVLELFLKRNGIRAEVFTERASIAPIKSKGHLNFNVWVSCASLQGMLECLYREIDIFILDRGIFDALVWNEWLKITGKITSDEAAQVEKFFTMERWTDLVDVVFVLSCEPAISIQREYADQLTTKRGTIMSEGTLNQFLQCVESTMQQNGNKFKKVVKIDTTQTTTQHGALKIADAALNALDEFVDESICVIPVSEQTHQLPPSGFFDDREVIDEFIGMVETKKQFVPRSKAEQDPRFLQPLPCAILRYRDKILVLKRKKAGHPLHDTYAVWAGGHVAEADDGPEILINTLKRELTEELFIKDAFTLNPIPVGLIRTNQDARASRHIAVLYEITLASEDVALALNQKEFRATRGSSMSGRLVDLSEITELYDSMGDWSKSIVDKFWPTHSGMTERPPLFVEPTG